MCLLKRTETLKFQEKSYSLSVLKRNIFFPWFDVYISWQKIYIHNWTSKKKCIHILHQRPLCIYKLIFRVKIFAGFSGTAIKTSVRGAWLSICLNFYWHIIYEGRHLLSKVFFCVSLRFLYYFFYEKCMYNIFIKKKHFKEFFFKKIWDKHLLLVNVTDKMSRNLLLFPNK